MNQRRVAAIAAAVVLVILIYLSWKSYRATQDELLIGNVKSSAEDAKEASFLVAELQALRQQIESQQQILLKFQEVHSSGKNVSNKEVDDLKKELLEMREQAQKMADQQVARAAGSISDDEIRKQFIKVPADSVECEDMYTTDSIKHWRENGRELCKAGEPPSLGLVSSMKCFNANHHASHNKFAPNTCKFANLVKRAQGWTSSCSFNDGMTHNLGTRWYNSGIGATVNKMALHVPSEEERTRPCAHIETRPTLMFTREQGTASNMFHEMAQILAMYITKHVHGVGDDVDDVLLVAFDRHHRNTQGRCDELLAAFNKNVPVTFDEDVPVDTCYTNAMLAFAGEESIAFWHKFVGIVPCHTSPLMMSFQRFILTGNGFPEPAYVSGVSFCWILRGAHSRTLVEEGTFLDRLRVENKHITLRIGEMGAGELSGLKQQIEWARQCNIMAGAHGAGLTHSMWMPEESVLIEILPPNFGSYRTLARSMGHQYLYVGASSPASVDWGAVKDVADAAVHLVNSMQISRDQRGLSII